MCGRGPGSAVLDWCTRALDRLLVGRSADHHRSHDATLPYAGIAPSAPNQIQGQGAAAAAAAGAAAALDAAERATIVSNGRHRHRRDAIALDLLGRREPEAEDLPVPARYYPDSLVELTRTARFTEDEIKRIYRGFKAECPTGIVKEDTFKGIYSQFFPLGASSGQYAHYVFNSIDLDRNGSLSFEEFVANLSILLRGTVDEKLQWTFSLYDINGDGCITKEEMKEIVTAIYELMGKVPEGCEEEQAIKEKVERLFEKMDRNCDGKITLDEFIECCTKDESIRRSIAVFDTIF
ncbi:Kv channel-interacting protein 4-like isoform X2 [Anopheles albimanus]|uniref:Kv channel-interacting protein 4-like isoform X2 n=1 Tax=Anopheles albimanus TaxID=7167 RepID=UPI001640B644|nr:Kv channel-interacting protein 4-like isoform X2 [Anopheles albimanus]